MPRGGGEGHAESDVKRLLIPVFWLTDFGGLRLHGFRQKRWSPAVNSDVMAPPSKAGARFAAAGVSVLEDQMPEDIRGEALRTGDRTGVSIWCMPIRSRPAGWARRSRRRWASRWW